MDYFSDHDSFLNYADSYNRYTELYYSSYTEYETFTITKTKKGRKTQRGTHDDYIIKEYVGEKWLKKIIEIDCNKKYVCEYGSDYAGIPIKRSWYARGECYSGTYTNSYVDHGPHTIYYYVPFSVEFTREDYESGIDLYDEQTFTSIYREDYNDFGEGNPLTIFYYLNGNIRQELFSNHKYIEYNYDGSLKCISHRIPYKCNSLPRLE